MLAVNDLLDAVLLGCFFFGLLFSAVVLVVGDAGIGSDLFGGDADGDGGPVPINLSTLVGFVAWFGGVGYLARNAGGWSSPLALGAGLVGGLVGGAAIAWVMAKLVSPQDGVMDAKDYRLPGTLGRVTSSIRAAGTGEVVYEQGGVRQVTAARAVDGQPIARGTEVIVLKSERGMALVQRSAVFFEDDLAGLAATSGRPVDTDASRSGSAT